MREDDRVFLLGEDIGAFGGAFGVTAGLFDEFGDERVMDTPISEEGFVGAAIGAAWMGERPVVELQFADFITCAFDPIVTVAAKTHWRSGQQIPVDDSLPDGRRRARRPVPRGVARRVVRRHGRPQGRVPREPSRTPTACSEPRSTTPTPSSSSSTSGSTARSAASSPRRPAADADRAGARSRGPATTHGGHLRLRRRDRARGRRAVDADVEIVDLRTVWPLDEAAILASVEKTSRVLVLQEASRSTGAAGVILSLVARRAFELLDAPPALHAAPDTPVPFAPELEDAYMPSVDSTVAALDELLAY